MFRVSRPSDLIIVVDNGQLGTMPIPSPRISARIEPHA